MSVTKTPMCVSLSKNVFGTSCRRLQMNFFIFSSLNFFSRSKLCLNLSTQLVAFAYEGESNDYNR